MPNPNIVSVTSIRGGTAYVTPTDTTANTAWRYDGTTSLTGLTPAAGNVHKIDSIVVSNLTGNTVPASLAISNNATFGSGTAFYLAYQINVPPNATLIVTDKTTSFYVTENQSIAAYSNTASALSFVASFEQIQS